MDNGVEQRHIEARHKILNEVLEASEVFIEPSKARFINDAMEMYAMYRIAEIQQELHIYKFCKDDSEKIQEKLCVGFAEFLCENKWTYCGTGVWQKIKNKISEDFPAPYGKDIIETCKTEYLYAVFKNTGGEGFKTCT
jgi:hypothetical protein